ncbi:MAG: M28 family peptidase [Polyangiaceae bacterium]
MSSSHATKTLLEDPHHASDEASFARAFVARILAEAPLRRPTSADERRGHELTRDAYLELGLKADLEPFTFNENLYATIALHMGTAVLGSLVAKRFPRLGFALHAASALSYALDSTRKAFLLRRIFPFKPSQNVVATLPSTGPMRLRIVFVSHGDAAFTGLVFHPEFVRRFGSRGGPLAKPMQASVAATALLAGLDALSIAGASGRVVDWARRVLTIPPLVAFALNADVTARDRIVPGASDNLSGVAGGVLLAKRFLAKPLSGVELVFVTTGCEEAGLGGAQALAESRDSAWSRANTIVITIDGLSGGKLHTFREGEVFPIDVPSELVEAVDHVRASDPRFADVTPYTIPVGGTDVVPFAKLGFDGISIGRVDPELHTPRNYHLPSDTLEAMDPAEIVESLDFVEALTRELARRRR